MTILDLVVLSIEVVVFVKVIVFWHDDLYRVEKSGGSSKSNDRESLQADKGQSGFSHTNLHFQRHHGGEDHVSEHPRDPATQV